MRNWRSNNLSLLKCVDHYFFSLKIIVIFCAIYKSQLTVLVNMYKTIVLVNTYINIVLVVNFTIFFTYFF